MKAKFFALLAVVLAMVSCQKDVDNLDVNMGGDVATISVTLPADAITRAAADETDSAWSGLQNVKDETLRVIFQVYDENGVTNEGLRQTTTLSEGELTANFNVRLVPGRQYTFVAWADQGEEYFDVTNLQNVQILDWDAMDECRDAFTATHTERNFTSSSNITLELIRPFAKLRVVTTDMAELGLLNITPDEAEVAYTVDLPNAFNAFAGEACATTVRKSFANFEIAEYNKDAANTMTLFTDYILVPADKVVKFSLKTMQDGGREIKTNDFVTDIPVERNNLTTIKGNILTDGNNINVEVKPEFDGEKEWPNETTAEQLAAAAMFGGEVTLTEDVELNQPLEVKGNMTINLNGKTIKNATNYAFENYAKLTINGNGKIHGLGGIRSHGGEITINGGTFTCSSDWNNGTYNHILKAVNTKVVINGGTFDATIDGTTNAMINVSENSIIAINGGTFKNVNGTIPQFAPYMFTYEKNGKLIINDGDFYGGWRFNGETATTDIYGGNFTVSYDGQSFHAASTHVLKVYGGVFDLNNGGKLNPTNYVATGYKVIEKDGKFAVVAEDVDNVVADKAEMKTVLEAAASAGSTNVVVDAMGANIGNLDYGLTKAMVPAGSTVTIRNAVVEGRSYGNGVNGTVIFDGCTFNNSGAYSIHFDNGNGDVIFKNCHLYGWNSFGSTLNSVSFENCTLDGNGTYALIRSYANLTVTNCTFNISEADFSDNYAEGVQASDGASLTENNNKYIVANTEALQDVLDSAKDNRTIYLTAGVNYGKVYMGRPTEYNNTVMYCGEGHDFTTNNNEEFKAHLKEGGWHPTPRYTTTLKNLTIVGANGATIAGLLATSGHATGEVYDYVLGKQHTTGSAYYSTLHLENIKFSNVAFTGKIDINTSDADSTYNGIYFEGCTFTTGGVDSTNGAAIRYYNEANNGKVKNIYVNNCEFNNCYQGVYVHHVNGVSVTYSQFENTGHNAIAMQGSNVNLKAAVINNNTFNNIEDRVIRFDTVAADSQITIKNNVATNSGDDAHEVIKATSLATGVQTYVSGNNWNGGVVVNPELQDK